MAEFVGSLNSFRQSLPFTEMDQSLDVMSHFDDLNVNAMENNPNLFLMGFNNDNFLPFLENFQSFSAAEHLKPATFPDSVAVSDRDNKRNREHPVSDTNSGSSSVTPFETTKKKKKKKKKNRGRSSSKEEEKPMDVVHVRARRGQATDSHSLAERVRREKINEKMRCLQDIVPGCYKTMGMAGMLDEIINYVQSLQNQVEFLSMKLTAASSYYDFNSDIETATPQQVIPRVGDSYNYQAEEMERLMREGYGSYTTYHTSMPF